MGSVADDIGADCKTTCAPDGEESFSQPDLWVLLQWAF